MDQSPPASPPPPEDAGRALSEEEVRVRLLPDHALLMEFAGLDSLIRFTSQARWGANEHCKPLVSRWSQLRLRVYVAEFVRRAAVSAGIVLTEAEELPNQGRVDGILRRLNGEGG